MTGPLPPRDALSAARADGTACVDAPTAGGSGSAFAAIADRASRDPSTLLAWFAIALTAVAIGAFVILRLLAPMHFMGWDEAYYLGIGANLLAGRGLHTVFGDVPAIHSPLWPLLLQAPAVSLHVDPTAWGHALAVLSGGAVVGLTAWFAWRSVRVAAPLAAAVMLAYPFFIDLAGWMGLDLPAAALTMLYVGLGIASVRRGSFLLGLAAGLVFAAAFLIKELALPFAPVPILAGLIRSTPIASLGRGGAGILLAASVGTSWWFVVYALEFGGVYRLGTPAWTLIPIAVGAGVLVLLGATIDWIVPVTARPPGVLGARRLARLGWALTVAWTVILVVYFAVAPNPIGTALLNATQLRAILARTAPAHLPLLALAVPGAVLAAGWQWMSRTDHPSSASTPSRDLLHPDERHAVDDLIVATIVGLPFVLLVIAVGEGPRHYIAQLGFLAALAAIGWTKAAARTASRLGIGVRAAPLAGAVLVLVGSGVVAMASFMPKAETTADLARASVVETSTAWIREYVPRGSAVVFGNGLLMETGLHLVGDFRLFEIQRDVGIHLDAAGALGLRASDGTRPDDWVALWTEGRDATAVFGYRASSLMDLFRGIGPAIWIETDVISEHTPSPELAMLRRTQGIEQLAHWSWPSGAGTSETVVYQVDPSSLAFSRDVIITAPALSRMIQVMERNPAAYRRAASTLLDRVQVAGPEPSASGLLDRLGSVAGR
jgi:hypothetical protein